MEWLPIETAPKDGSLLILGAPDHVRTGYWAITGCWHDHAYSYRNIEWCDLSFKPTHWMPLPPAPAATRPQ